MRSHKTPYPILILTMMLGYALVFIDESGMAVNLKAINHELQLSQSALYWIINGYLIIFSVLLLYTSKLAGYFGAKKLFQVGILIFALSSILCGMAINDYSLILGRLGQGFGASLLLPSMPILILRHTEEESFSKVFGIVLSAANTFYALGPMFGGVVCHYFSWRYFFWINVPVAFLAFILARSYLVNHVNDHPKSFQDYKGLVLFITAFSSITILLMQIGYWGLFNTYSLICYLLIAITLPYFILHEKHHHDPMLDLTFFNDKKLSCASIILVICAMALTSIMFFAVWFQISYAMNAQIAGLALLPATIGFIIIPSLQGMWVAKSGVRQPLLFGIFLICLSLFWIMLCAKQQSFWLLLPGLIVFGVGIPLAIPSAIMTIMLYAKEEHKDIAAGIYVTFRQLGLTFGVAVFGAILSNVAINNHASAATMQLYSQRMLVALAIMLALSLSAFLLAWCFIHKK